MRKSVWSSFGIVALVAVLFLSTPQSGGAWGYGCGYGYGGYGYGGYGGYGCGYGYWGGSCYGGGWSYPCYSYSYSRPCYSGSYGRSYGGWTYAVPVYSGGRAYAAASPGWGNETPVSYSEDGDNSGRQKARIQVKVPAEAKVWFDGEETHQTGAVRNFVTPPLQTGKSYHYQVQARWVQDGEPVSRTRTLRIDPGKQADLDFTRPETTE
jgi:uncharacterized protein (TIGR03000 family)